MTRQIYPVGDTVPLGELPENMHAWLIKRGQHGEPRDAFVRGVVPVRKPRAHEVTILVMAAGINFNGVWAALGKPVSVFGFHDGEYQIPGSDAAGIVWAVGSEVRRVKVGDEVVVHCGQVDADDEEALGGDPMLSRTQRIWGYETQVGAFAQFATVQSQQVLFKPRALSWEQSASYLLKLATAYRMLFGHPPHTVKPGSRVLVWGAAGGIGSFAVQLCSLVGASAVGVVSSDDRSAYVRALGATGVVNRSEFRCWGRLPPCESPDYQTWLSEAKRFGRAVWAQFDTEQSPDIVFEHPGEDTFALSCFVAARGGMIVYCGATSGASLTFDARYGWMHQKRIQGSHFASMKQAAQANRLVIEGQIVPPHASVFEWDDLAHAHQRLYENVRGGANLVVRVGARAGDAQRTLPSETNESTAEKRSANDNGLNLPDSRNSICTRQLAPM